ncbi:MAG TPA: 30S ribosomal protein S12 methylthiotransferase RimO [Patescibacteria group bacterium]|nr:30S ribosomal protein S12 methylthiotransferase RimO [Patescibacteria group bacterium]
MSGAGTDNPRATYYFFNLGCPKNLVDAERVASRLEEAGWRMASSPDGARLLVVTTCAFITRAEEESIEEILRVASHKQPWQHLAVLGCLVSREGERLPELFPEVDTFLSVEGMEHLAEMVELPVNGRPRAPLHAANRMRRRLFTPPHVAYLKIAEGCSNRCCYCTIPGIRGPLTSRSPDEIIEEAVWLVGRGVREIVLVAQDTAAWGADSGDGRSLWGLMKSLSAAVAPVWIRLMYLHPAHIDLDRLVSLLEGDVICRYVDIPIQHVSNGVLRGMGRRYGKTDLERLFGALRSRVDHLVIRTSVMVGFPGESVADLEDLAEFLETYEFDHVGVFTFSPERGTPAARLKGRVAAAEAVRRRNEILEIQMDVSHRLLESRVGGVETILVDELIPPADAPRSGIWGVGRFYGQAYEVDGVTFLGGEPRRPGALVPGRIEHAEAYDLFARVI